MNYRSDRLYPAKEAIESVKRNNYTQILTLAFIRFFIGWCLFSGVLILIFRSLHLRAPFIYLFLNGILLAVIYGVDYANKHKASENVCVACVDAYNKAGGLLISEYETGDLSWSFFRKTRYAVPEINIQEDYKRLLGILLIALLFVGGSFYVPLLNLNKYSNRRINISKKVSEIKEQIELLQQEDIISSEERVKLETALDEIEKKSNNESPGITFEALDQMSEKLRYEASDEMKKRIKDMEVLKKLENFAKEAKKANGDTKKIQEELEKLKKQLRQLGLDEAQINDLLNNYLGDSMTGNGINNSNMGNLSKSLNKIGRAHVWTPVKEYGNKQDNSGNANNSNNDSGKNVQNSSRNGEYGASSNSENSQSGKDGDSSNSGNNQSGKDGDSGNSENGQVSNDGSLNMIGDGEGGIGKGGGKTPMTFGDKTSDHNAKYHDETLPSVNPESAVGATSLGIGIADPEVSREKEKYNTGSIKYINYGENSLNKKNILPKHRNAVKNYFK